MKYYFYKVREKRAKENNTHAKHSEENHSKEGEHYGVLTRDFDALYHTMLNIPHTWDAYPKNGKGYMDIIRMEYEELLKADREGDYRGTIENFLHISAACLAAHHLMTCNK